MFISILFLRRKDFAFFKRTTNVVHPGEILFGSPLGMKMIPLPGKEGSGVIVVRWPSIHHSQPLLPLRRGVIFMAAKGRQMLAWRPALCRN
jgi:hypothetical protein